MITEMVLSSESFATDVTGEGPLIGMSALVNQQVVRFGELSLTEATDEFFPSSFADSTLFV